MPQTQANHAWWLFLLCWLTGCSGQGQVVVPRLTSATYGSVELGNTPFFSQRDYQCGPAALATVLNAAGQAVTPDALEDRLFIPARKGSLQIELLAATRQYGYLPYVIAPDPDALLAELHQGRPVLILQNLGLRSLPVWHYAVLIGYQADEERFLLRSGTNPRLSVPTARFLRTWRAAGYWGMVALPPGSLPAQPDAGRYLQATADLEAVGQQEAALACYHTASQRWPDQRIAWLGLGNSLYALHHLPEAEQAYRVLLQRAPADPVAHNNLAQVLADRGCTAEALSLLDAALSGGFTEPLLQDQLRLTRRDILRTPNTAPPCNH